MARRLGQGAIERSVDYRWAAPEELDHLAFDRASRKLLPLLWSASASRDGTAAVLAAEGERASAVRGRAAAPQARRVENWPGSRGWSNRKV